MPVRRRSVVAVERYRRLALGFRRLHVPDDGLNAWRDAVARVTRAPRDLVTKDGLLGLGLVLARRLIDELRVGEAP